MYNKYMALHIADIEVTILVSDLAKIEGTTKTEALRRLLRKAIAERQTEQKRAGFREFALSVAAEARGNSVAPSTKQEMDDLWGESGQGMNDSDGD
jgi:hypothetical protein